MKSPIIVITIFSLLGIIGCQKEDKKKFLGSAVVECDVWKVSPSTAGELASLMVREGDPVSQGQTIAVVDTVPLALKRQELLAARAEATALVEVRKTEVQTLLVRAQGTAREAKRSDSLAAQGAIPNRQKDELATANDAAQTQIKTAQAAIKAALLRLQSIDAQLASLEDMLRRCQVKAPATGTVLNRYRNPGEQVAPGRPLISIGKTDSMQADFFVPQSELSQLQLGMPLRLRVEGTSEAQWLSAKITWIASEAEFTPKSVQTRETRGELVFRIRALAANSKGILKRGLPIEVWLP